MAGRCRSRSPGVALVEVRRRDLQPANSATLIAAGAAALRRRARRGRRPRASPRVCRRPAGFEGRVVPLAKNRRCARKRARREGVTNVRGCAWRRAGSARCPAAPSPRSSSSATSSPSSSEPNDSRNDRLRPSAVDRIRASPARRPLSLPQCAGAKNRSPGGIKSNERVRVARPINARHTQGGGVDAVARRGDAGASRALARRVRLLRLGADAAPSIARALVDVHRRARVGRARRRSSPPRDDVPRPPPGVTFPGAPPRDLARPPRVPRRDPRDDDVRREAPPRVARDARRARAPSPSRRVVIVEAARLTRDGAYLPTPLARLFATLLRAPSADASTARRGTSSAS